MNKRRSVVSHYQGFHNQMGLEFMSTPYTASSTPYRPDLQTQDYRPLRKSDELVLNPSAVADSGFFWPDNAIQQLQEVRQEVEEALELDSEIAPVPDSAYDDAYWFLGILFDHNVSMPDIGWLMDGGIGLEWRSRDRNGIATISIYGDDQIVYGASLGSGLRDKGTCALSDLRSLTRFFTMLALLFSQ